MRRINYQCVYDVDDEKYPYTAFDGEGRLCGFKNPPIRDFKNHEWIDSTDGTIGDIIFFSKWDTSMREPGKVFDCKRVNEQKGKKAVYISKAYKKGEKVV